MKIKPEILSNIEAAGVTQKDIALKMGISYQTIWKRQRDESWKPEGVHGFVAAVNALTDKNYTIDAVVIETK